jgi:hypothetical protein
MRVLKLTLGKLIFLQIIPQFLFFSVKRLDGLSLHPDGCSSDRRTVSPCVWVGVAQMGGWSGDTSGRVRPVACLCGNVRSGELVIRPDRDPIGYMLQI